MPIENPADWNDRNLGAETEQGRAERARAPRRLHFRSASSRSAPLVQRQNLNPRRIQRGLAGQLGIARDLSAVAR